MLHKYKRRAQKNQEHKNKENLTDKEIAEKIFALERKVLKREFKGKPVPNDVYSEVGKQANRARAYLKKQKRRTYISYLLIVLVFSLGIILYILSTRQKYKKLEHKVCDGDIAYFLDSSSDCVLERNGKCGTIKNHTPEQCMDICFRNRTKCGAINVSTYDNELICNFIVEVESYRDVEEATCLKRNIFHII